jgi:ribonuclease P protein component
MSGRDFRLRTPEDFRRALRTRPIAKSPSVAIHQIVLGDGFGLGFIVPKKLIRHANQRNRIKRWSRELFREHLMRAPDLCSKTPPFAIVVRLVGVVGPGWAASRGAGREELRQLFQQVAMTLAGASAASDCS